MKSKHKFKTKFMRLKIYENLRTARLNPKFICFYEKEKVYIDIAFATNWYC